MGTSNNCFNLTASFVTIIAPRRNNRANFASQKQTCKLSKCCTDASRKDKGNIMKKLLIAITLLILSMPIWAGLDIGIYTGLTIAINPNVDEYGYPYDEDNQVLVVENKDFPGRIQGLRNNTVYNYTKYDTFDAGSYSSYNWWRNELARIAGYKPIEFIEDGKSVLKYDETAWRLKNGPFWEIINFTDADGAIGPVVSEKLYRDFQKYKDKAMHFKNEYFIDVYLNFLNAFDVARKNGLILFQ